MKLPRMKRRKKKIITNKEVRTVGEAFIIYSFSISSSLLSYLFCFRLFGKKDG